MEKRNSCVVGTGDKRKSVLLAFKAGSAHRHLRNSCPSFFFFSRPRDTLVARTIIRCLVGWSRYAGCEIGHWDADAGARNPSFYRTARTAKCAFVCATLLGTRKQRQGLTHICAVSSGG